MPKRSIKEIIFLCVLFVLITIGTVIGFTHCLTTIPETETEQYDFNTFTLEISYDGKDYYGNESSNSDNVNVRNEEIPVVDVLPEGIEFVNFIRNASGNTIRAVRTNGSNTSCTGYVVNDTGDGAYTYKGLRYVPSTHSINFTIARLEAGCSIRVQYRTQTDSAATLADYYNYFKVTSNGKNYYSNYTRLYVGNGMRNTVNYEYTGTVPADAPEIPTGQLFTTGASVKVFEAPEISGYTFSGWRSREVTPDANGNFTMPSGSVTFRGTFTAKPTHKVTYVIEGYKPDEYIVPKEKNVAVGELFFIDNYGDDVEFTGHYAQTHWTSEDVTINDGRFIMPNKDVVLKSTFAKRMVYVGIDYEPTLPPSLANILPTEITYACGEEPVYPTMPNDPMGRLAFSGWEVSRSGGHNVARGVSEITGSLSDPCRSYTIKGIWAPKSNITDIEVFKTVPNQKSGYHTGEKIEYEIKVKNGIAAADDIFLEESLSGVTIQPGNGYVIETPNLIRIPHIDPSHVVTIHAEMEMPSGNEATITNTIRRLSADIPEGMYLSDKNAEASVTVNRGATLTVCNHVDHPLNEKVFQFRIDSQTLDNEFQTWINLKDGECKTMDIGTGYFDLQEIVPQEYSLDHTTGFDNFVNDPTYTDTGNNRGTILLNPGDNKTVHYYNVLAETGFLHSYGSVENTIPSSEMPELLPARTSSIVFVSSYQTSPGTQYMPAIKFNNPRTTYNVVEYDQNEVIDGSYKEPGDCSYYNCPIPKNVSTNSSYYINNEYRFLGWSTVPQDQLHLRGYNFTEAEGKITFSNGVPTNMDIPEGDVVTLYAIYDYYHPPGKECTMAEVTYYDVDYYNQYPIYHFNFDDFTDKSLLSPDMHSNKVIYGYCNDETDQTYNVIQGEYHTPIREVPGCLEEPIDYARFWFYFGHEGTPPLDPHWVGEGSDRYIYRWPIGPGEEYYTEMQKFGVSQYDENNYDIEADLMRFAIRSSDYVDPNYLKFNAYAPGRSTCPWCT